MKIQQNKSHQEYLIQNARELHYQHTKASVQNREKSCLRNNVFIMERFKKKTGNEVGEEESSQVSKTQPFFIIIETRMVVHC